MINYLDGIKKQFHYYKSLAEKAIAQIPEDKLFWQYNDESNSVATIVKHLWGNMRSRWTDLLTSDGEKAWRDRDAEFENDIQTREELLAKWHEGWKCFFDAIDQLTDADLEKEIYIRNTGQPVFEAINRQLAHYPYHIGQIVFIAKMTCEGPWNSLSIPRGSSKQYNTIQFEQPKHKAHYTDEFLRGKKE